jgi:hypothetical protein
MVGCRRPLILASVVTVAALSLLAAGCGGGRAPGVAVASSTTAATTTTPQAAAVAFARCMRSNGVLNWPDPPSSGAAAGKPTLQQLGVSSFRFQAAVGACNHLLPNGGGPPSQAARQQVRAQALRFAECVRSHGVTNFPDPDRSGRIDPASVAFDQGSPKFQAANQACGKYRPPYIPSNAAYDAYVRTHG